MRDGGDARPMNGARGKPFGKCAGFDSSERAMGYRGQPLSKITLALMASKVAAARLVRMKLGVHGVAADEHMPFARHRTVAEVWESQARTAIKRVEHVR